MEQKIVRVPFDVELAKQITNGEVDGKIVTRDGDSVRILCWDKKDKVYPIAALVDNGVEEDFKTYTNEGVWSTDKSCTLKKHDLMLEIPEYMTFKDGDILSYDGGIFILKRFDGKDRAEYYASIYGPYTALDSACLMKDLVNKVRLATEEEKKKLSNSLKESKHLNAKEYLRRFFGIEVIIVPVPFEFKQMVLVRCTDKDPWVAAEFSHKANGYYFVFGGCMWDMCIPYNEQTAHLLGKTDNWEG